MDPPRTRRGRHSRDGGAYHAGPHRVRAGGRTQSSYLPCGPGIRGLQGGSSLGAQGPWSAAEVGFVNAYGLTETSSTIAVLSPDDHRDALAASDDAAARRLGSVGQPVPGIEVQIRSEDGAVVEPGQTGELFVRGEQVSGRYTDIGSVLDADGWFPTKDVAMLDEAGYLFIGGRSDDTIIRGGENIAPPKSRMSSSSIPRCAIVWSSAPRIPNGARSSSRWWYPPMAPATRR